MSPQARSQHGVHTHSQALDTHQALWEQLEDLDSHTQLLDLASALTQPYSCCSRCIALGNGASCQVKLSPAAPRALPASVVFHGPSSVVAALHTSWYSTAHRLWQEQLSVRENLQTVLQVGGAAAAGTDRGKLPADPDSQRLAVQPAASQAAKAHLLPLELTHIHLRRGRQRPESAIVLVGPCR